MDQILIRFGLDDECRKRFRDEKVCRPAYFLHIMLGLCFWEGLEYHILPSVKLAVVTGVFLPIMSGVAVDCQIANRLVSLLNWESR